MKNIYKERTNGKQENKAVSSSYLDGRRSKAASMHLAIFTSLYQDIVSSFTSPNQTMSLREAATHAKLPRPNINRHSQMLASIPSEQCREAYHNLLFA